MARNFILLHTIKAMMIMKSAKDRFLWVLLSWWNPLGNVHLQVAIGFGFGFDSHKLTSGGGEEHNAYRFNLTTAHFPLSCGNHRRVPTYGWFHFLILSMSQHVEWRCNANTVWWWWGWGGDIRHFNRSRRITVAIGTTDRMQFPKSSTYVVNAWTFS